MIPTVAHRAHRTLVGVQGLDLNDGMCGQDQAGKSGAVRSQGGELQHAHLGVTGWATGGHRVGGGAQGRGDDQTITDHALCDQVAIHHHPQVGGLTGEALQVDVVDGDG